jgi:hypothetical protein
MTPADPLSRGLEAGRHFRIRCPYPSGSKEAEAWKLGWADGVMEDACEDDPDRSKSAGWQQLLKMLHLR